MISCNARLDRPVMKIGSRWLNVNNSDAESAAIIDAITNSGSALITSKSWWHYKFSPTKHLSVVFVDYLNSGAFDMKISVSGLPFSQYDGFFVDGICGTLATDQFLGIVLWVNSFPRQYYYGFVHLNQPCPILDLRYQTTDHFLSISFLQQGTRANSELAGYMLFLNEQNSVYIHPLTKDIVVTEKF